MHGCAPNTAGSDCFNPCFNGSVERGCAQGLYLCVCDAPVSILVLMEVLREVKYGRIPTRRKRSFNPCFNGSVERGRLLPAVLVAKDIVSILVLMEVLREGVWSASTSRGLLMFQSLF